MQRDLGALEDREFDLLIIGGGISGACLAHDAALRGLSVALVEQNDFGAATSAASSKILHGGIRYLQHGQLRKLRESVLERSRFQAIAPHLTHYVPFLIPTYRGFRKGRAVLHAGVTLYTLLCTGQDRAIRDPEKLVPPWRSHTRAETLRLAPVLDDQPALTGSIQVPESLMHSSERMTLAFVKTAAANGAAVANYVGVDELLTDGRMARAVRAHSRLGRHAALEIRARLVVNATGPWLPALNRRFELPGLHRSVTRFSKGVHLVTRAVTDEVALVLPTSRPQQTLFDRGGRALFVIPWRGRSLIGTTNTPFGGTPDETRSTAQDVRDFLRDLEVTLPRAGLTERDVLHTFAGLYPLTANTIRPEMYQGTGEYQIVDHGRLGHTDGVISVLGAKYTTARRLAEISIDLAIAKLGLDPRPCRTARTPLVGGDIEHLPSFREQAERRFADRVPPDVVRHLVQQYGREIDAVLGAPPDPAEAPARLAADRISIEAEVGFAVREEMAVQLDDVIFRRTGLGTLGHPGRACLDRCATIMGGALGWTDAYRAEQVAKTTALFLPGGDDDDETT